MSRIWHELLSATIIAYVLAKEGRRSGDTRARGVRQPESSQCASTQASFVTHTDGTIQRRDSWRHRTDE